MRIVIIRIVILSAILFAPGLVTGADPTAAQRFVGHWRLVSCEQRSTSGEVTQPYGKDPIGRISYDAAGHMAAQLMRRDRAKFANSNPSKGTDAENREAFTGYLAYYGAYTVDEKEGTVTHHVEGAWFPNWIGANLVRHYQFQGNRLTLRADLPDGPSVLVWERVP